MATDSDSYNNYAQQAAREKLMEESNHNPDATLPLLKLLIPKYAAGSLIGKGGELMKQMKNQFAATICLSNSRDLYPGTDERIVVITGKVDEIVELNNHIMENILGEENRQARDAPRCEQVKIVLTNEAAGLLIGSGGATIKAIQEDTNARINISNRDASYVHGERILNMSGSLENRKKGCRSVIEKISSEITNVANKRLKYTNNVIPHGLVSTYYDTRHVNNSQYFSVYNTMGPVVNNMDTYETKCKLKTNTEIEMHLPDAIAGYILGKQGVIINELMQYSGAKLQFSPKDDFVPGTTDRVLKITGDFAQAKMGYSLVCEKIEEAEQQLKNEGY